MPKDTTETTDLATIGDILSQPFYRDEIRFFLHAASDYGLDINTDTETQINRIQTDDWKDGKHTVEMLAAFLIGFGIQLDDLAENLPDQPVSRSQAKELAKLASRKQKAELKLDDAKCRLAEIKG